jgi:hypothetical protein
MGGSRSLSWPIERETQKEKCFFLNGPKYFFLYYQAHLNFHFITLVSLMSFTKKILS